MQSFSGHRALLLLSAVALGCASHADKGGDNLPAGSAGSNGTYTAGCTTVPQCGTCGTCFEACYCQTGDTPNCVNACSSAGGSGSGGSPSSPSSGGAPQSQGAGGVSASSGGVSNPGAGGASDGAGGATPGAGGASNVPPDAQEFSITSAKFDIPPGEEVYKCQNFKNPLGKDIAIVESTSFMAPGSHHMFVFHGAADNTDTNAVADCSGIEFSSDFLHASQTPQQTASYPVDVGRLLKGGDGLRILVHYINQGADTLTGQVAVKFKYVDPSRVKYLAAEIFLNQAGLIVAPGTSAKTWSYTTPWPVKLMLAVSHMHSHAVGFTAQTSTGKILYQGSDWNEPEPTLYDPPVDLPAGTAISWTCNYQNDTGRNITFGESATNEMCIFVGTYYTTDPAHQGQSMNDVTGFGF